MNAFPASGLLITLAFLLAVLATVSGALLAVLSHRLIRGVCGLALCSFGLAGLYYFLHSPFLALMKILIYVGAVCVTIVFAVMLAEPDEPKEPGPRNAGGAPWRALALLVSAATFWSLTRLGLSHPWSLVARPDKLGSLEEIGLSLLTTYSLAFEAISLVLLVAILGALVIARYGRTRP
jgi:NADH-quinone oxidoreductase subunit J